MSRRSNDGLMGKSESELYLMAKFHQISLALPLQHQLLLQRRTHQQPAATPGIFSGDQWVHPSPSKIPRTPGRCKPIQVVFDSIITPERGRTESQRGKENSKERRTEDDV